MSILLRLRSSVKFISSRRLHSAKYVFDNDNRQSYENIFPQISIKDIQNLWQKSSQCVYAGFDPTAESLHIGNLLILVNLLHWHRCGHQVIILLGGATGLIGDPSYRKSERVEMQQIILDENLKQIKEDIKRVIKNYEKFICKESHILPPIEILNNIEWYRGTNLLPFIKNIGKYFRMGTMLGRASVQSRLESDSGMSFTEFCYPLFQGYDWLHLQQTYNCNFQIGGQDQMGNIVSGYDLVTRYTGKQVYGLTLPLITAEGGKKFGKSTGNAVWLSPKKTSSFQLYQYFIRTEDADVEKLLYFFTFIPVEKIKNIMEMHRTKPEERVAQKALAEKVTLLAHGPEGLLAARKASAVLYDKSLPMLAQLNVNDLVQILEGATVVEMFTEAGLTIYELAMKAKCFKTDHDARRIIEAGGFYINHQKITNTEEVVVPGIHILGNNVSLLRVGKRTYHVVRWV